MISIRKNVFETNSSSSHSLVVRKEDYVRESNGSLYFTHDEMLESLDRVENGEYVYYLDEWYFGRSPFRVLSTFQEKFQYAYASAKNEDMENVQNLLFEFVPEVNRFKPPKYRGTDDYMLWSWLEKLGIDLKEFLINRKYIIICDGDEYCYWSLFKKANLLDTSVIEAEYE